MDIKGITFSSKLNKLGIKTIELVAQNAVSSEDYRNYRPC